MARDDITGSEYIRTADLADIKCKEPVKRFCAVNEKWHGLLPKCLFSSWGGITQSPNKNNNDAI